MILENASKNGELVVEWLKVELENTSAGGRRLLEQGGGWFFLAPEAAVFYLKR